MQELGTAIDKVTLDIDLHIIEHFSKHLYSSPNKAVEELVANGYDADATKVLVYLPGTYTDNVIIWDNGFSMNVKGLQALWKVADSPKKNHASRDITSRTGGIRKVIGKFGIGKIASYTIGNKIHHICKSGGVFLSVGIDYDILLNSPKSNGQAHEESKIYKLTEAQAKEILTKSFKVIPDDFENFFNSDSWTFALIEEIKDINLPEGRIKWILGNGMPLQPQFSVYVNNNLVQPSITKNGLVCEWDFGKQEIIDQLNKKWEEAVKAGIVSGKLKFGKSQNLDPEFPALKIPYVEFPNLGKIWGKNRLYNKSLLDNRISDIGRSHGFFIMVRGRLINQDDAQFFLNDPSFATFYSSQYILHVDGLDEDLLADRERVQETSVCSKELKVLQKSTYLAMASKQRKELELISGSEKIQNRLPVDSSQYFLEPLAALWMKTGSGEELGFDFREPKIDSKPLGSENHISEFSTNKGFTVNSDHPYYQNLTKLLGNGKQAQKVVKEFEVIAVSEKLFEGHLFEIGISDEQISKIMLWRDEMYRRLAKADTRNLHQLGETLKEASYKGGGEFEKAIADMLNTIGFISNVDGASGKKDIFVKAFCGDGSYKLTFEAKGSSAPSLKNDEAETGGANNHRIEAGADHAVIVARKFAGFERSNQKPAIIAECESMGTVSIMEVDALIDLAYSVKEHSYSLDSLKEVFTSIESPALKKERIQKLINPLDNFDYVDFLNKIWEKQDVLGQGHSVSIKPIWQEFYRDKGLEEIEILNKVEALRTLVYPVIQYDQTQKEVALRQSPENIVQLIQNKFLIPLK